MKKAVMIVIATLVGLSTTACHSGDRHAAMTRVFAADHESYEEQLSQLAETVVGVLQENLGGEVEELADLMRDAFSCFATARSVLHQTHGAALIAGHLFR